MLWPNNQKRGDDLLCRFFVLAVGAYDHDARHVGDK